MDTKLVLEFLSTKPKVTASDVKRHFSLMGPEGAKDALEALTAEGKVVKVTHNKKVHYSLVIPLTADTLPEPAPVILSAEMNAVLAALRPSKALSVKCISRRCRLPRPTVSDLLGWLVGQGVVRKPYHNSERFLPAA